MRQTPVIFRTYPDGEVVALFPTLPGGRFGECTSYVHFGQHRAADHGHVVRTTRPARPDEYADLHAELVRVGYDDLSVYRREQPWMHRERLDAHSAAGGPASRDGDTGAAPSHASRRRVTDGRQRQVHM